MQNLGFPRFSQNAICKRKLQKLQNLAPAMRYSRRLVVRRRRPHSVVILAGGISSSPTRAVCSP